MWLIAQGFFLNHPFYTEVGEFQCEERNEYHFISWSEICEVWWLHFKISVVQIDQFPAPLKPSEMDFLHSCWSDASLRETMPEAKGRKSWSQASANTALRYIHAFLDGTRYRQQPIYQGLWEHRALLPSCLGCASIQLHPRKDAQPTPLLCCFSERQIFYSLIYVDPGQNRTRSSTLWQCVRAVHRQLTHRPFAQCHVFISPWVHSLAHGC